MGKEIIGMLHLMGSDSEDIVRKAAAEAMILQDAGFSGMIVENYFGSTVDVLRVLEKLSELNLEMKIGINILGNMLHALHLSNTYSVDFIQIDSVCGHLDINEDISFSSKMKKYRRETAADIYGGVRFKYQPVLSGREEKDDILIGAQRCDAMVVSSDGTGIEADVGKIKRFRDVLPQNKKLIVGSGVTAKNIQSQLEFADGCIIGSWLKEDHIAHGNMSPKNVNLFMKEVRKHYACR